MKIQNMIKPVGLTAIVLATAISGTEAYAESPFREKLGGIVEKAKESIRPSRKPLTFYPSGQQIEAQDESDEIQEWNKLAMAISPAESKVTIVLKENIASLKIPESAYCKSASQDYVENVALDSNFENQLFAPMDEARMKRREEARKRIAEMREAGLEKKPAKTIRIQCGVEKRKSEKTGRKKNSQYYAQMEGNLETDGTLYLLPENQRNEKAILRLADALYLEGRGVHEEGEDAPMKKYLEMIGGTVLERTIKGWRGVDSIEEAIDDNSQYSFTREDNNQNKISTKVRDHAKKNILDWTAYQR